MNPVTHLLIGWSAANTCGLSKRERLLVTVAGIMPDIDGLGIIPDILTRNTAHHLQWWGKYHHQLGHNLGMGLMVALAAFCLAARRRVTAALAAAAFHLHLLCDLLGARGPDGDQWPIPYLLPFSNAWQLSWEGQWALNAWPNFVITGIALAVTFFVAWKRGLSPLEIVSARANAAFVTTLRDRFGKPNPLNQAH